MAEKTEKRKVVVRRLEKAVKETDVKVIFTIESCGEYSLDVDKDEIGLFVPGTEYEGVFRISGIPDFPGEADKFENVSTVNYHLKRLFKEDKLVYWILD